MFDVFKANKKCLSYSIFNGITSSNNQKIYKNIIKSLFTQNKIIVFGYNFTFTVLIKHTKITTRDLYLIFQQKKVFFSLQLMPILFDKIWNLILWVPGSFKWFLGQVPLREMSTLLSWVRRLLFGAQRLLSPAVSVCACASATSCGSPSAQSPWCTGRSLHTWKAAKQIKYVYFNLSAVRNYSTYYY